MKILHIISELLKGGAERLVLDICHTLSKNKDHDVRLITFRPGNAYTIPSTKFVIDCIPSQVIPSLTGKWLIEVKSLQTFISQFQPDVIHSHLFETEVVLSQVDCGRALRVMHFHDNMPQLARFTWKTLTSKNQFTNWYERSVVLRAWNKLDKKCAVVIANDSYHYANTVLDATTGIHKLLNGIQVDRFSPKKVKEKQPKLCMIGSLVAKKNQALAIRTVHSLEQKGYTFDLDLLGEGPERQNLETLAKTLDIESLIHFRGNVDDPENYLHEAFAYLHTAWYEPLGLVLLEAMAAETPIVCMDGKGNRDLIQHGENGFIFEKQDPVLLAEQIIALWEDETIYEKIQGTARKNVRSFDIAMYCEQLMQVYIQHI